VQVKAKNQGSRFLQQYESKNILHTLKMAMQAETCSVKQGQLNVRQLTSTIKLHVDGNITCKTY
jgi:hypothetical protein